MSEPADPTEPLVAMMSVQDLRRQLSAVQRRLSEQVASDPQAVVDGVALRLIDTLAASAAMYFDRHPLIDRLASGEADRAQDRRPARSSDLLIAVDLLLHALPPITE